MNNTIKEIKERLAKHSNNRTSRNWFYYIGLHELATKHVYFILSLYGDRWHKNSMSFTLETSKNRETTVQDVSDVIVTLCYINKYGLEDTILKYKKGELPGIEEVINYAYFCSSYTPMYIHPLSKLKEVNKYVSDINYYTNPKNKLQSIVKLDCNKQLSDFERQLEEILYKLSNNKTKPKNMKPIKTNKGSDLDIDQNKPENNVVIQGQSTPVKHLESFKNLNSKLSNLVKIYNDDFNSTLGELYNTALKAHKAAFELYLTLDLTSGYKISTLKETEEVDVIDVKNYSINRNNPRSVLEDAMGTLKYYREEYDHLTDYIQKASEEIENSRIK